MSYNNYKHLKELDEEIIPFLRQLYFHHESQAKSHSDKCSPKYHKQLSKKLKRAENTLKKLLGES
jgi:hypothetical protein